MAKKSIKVNLGPLDVGRLEKGVAFEIFDGGEKFGELIVSTGQIRWKPKHKKYFDGKNWPQFAALWDN
mgnify:CR=1 FL=1